MAPEERDPPAPEVLQGELEAGLAEALPGLEIVDRDLDLDGLVVDLVAVDPQGRLVLVLLPEDSGDGAVLTALDALARGREHVALVARHLDRPRLARDLAPQVVLITERFEPRTLQRLSVFDEGQLTLLEVREVRSATTVSTFFISVPRPMAPAEAGARGAEAFFGRLAETPRAHAELVSQRLARLGDEVRLAAGPERLEWRFRGSPLGALVAIDGILHASSAAGAPRPLATEAEVEAFVEGSLERYVGLLDGPPAVTDDLSQVAIVPSGTGPLLTREELEAFRED